MLLSPLLVLTTQEIQSSAFGSYVVWNEGKDQVIISSSYYSILRMRKLRDPVAMERVQCHTSGKR